MKAEKTILALTLAALSGSALAHPGLMQHPEMNSGLLHILMHLLMLLPIGIGVYGLSRLILKQFEPKAQPVKNRNK